MIDDKVCSARRINEMFSLQKVCLVLMGSFSSPNPANPWCELQSLNTHFLGKSTYLFACWFVNIEIIIILLCGWSGARDQTLPRSSHLDSDRQPRSILLYIDVHFRRFYYVAIGRVKRLGQMAKSRKIILKLRKLLFFTFVWE